MRLPPLLAEHPAWLRVVLAGAVPVLFGALTGYFLGVHEIHGATAKADLPDPAVLLIVATAVLGVAFGAIGGYLRARARARPAG